ncbi:MAG TPA: hypothetical protein PKW79_03250 [Rhabdochlamydiaceae bacterium]|nr:hypothetical protein [Rhabdochlamydiaceae bacterium]
MKKKKRKLKKTSKWFEVFVSLLKKWRPASNYIALTLLEEAFARHDNVAYGTTSTGGHIPAFLKKVHDAGYDITLLLCSCDDSIRKAAIEYRNEQQRF